MLFEICEEWAMFGPLHFTVLGTISSICICTFTIHTQPPRIWLGLLWIYKSVWSKLTSLQQWFFQSMNKTSSHLLQFSSVQSLSRVRLFVTPWTAAYQASLSVTNSQSLLKLISIESVMPSSHLILCGPLSFRLQSFPTSGSFQMSQVLPIRWPQYCSFSFSISPSNEHPGLISFRKDWLDLLAGQGILKSLLQHHSSKASILQHSAFFIVQLSHPYMTTGKP